MAKCPVCSADIPDDFGLIECGSCGAQLIVHVDGTVEHSNQQPNSEPLPVEAENPDGDGVIEQGDMGEGMEDFEEQVEIPPPENIFEESPAPEAEVYVPPGAVSASPDLSDIARFGNSDASSGREGSLRYNLSITGIDTADVREAFREALTDRKFMWDVEQILRSVRNGEVQLQNVAATKAFILVSRLRNLPVRVKWEQYAIQQA